MVSPLKRSNATQPFSQNDVTKAAPEDSHRNVCPPTAARKTFVSPDGKMTFKLSCLSEASSSKTVRERARAKSTAAARVRHRQMTYAASTREHLHQSHGYHTKNECPGSNVKRSPDTALTDTSSPEESQHHWRPSRNVTLLAAAEAIAAVAQAPDEAKTAVKTSLISYNAFIKVNIEL